MTGSSSSRGVRPSASPKVAFTRRTLLILLLTVTGQLISYTEGMKCYECSSIDKDNKCPAGSPTKDCGDRIEGCFSLRVTEFRGAADGGKKVYESGGCNNIIQCAYPKFNRTGIDYHDLARNNKCSREANFGNETFLLLRECRVDENYKEAPPENIDIHVTYCPCGGPLCNGVKSEGGGGGGGGKPPTNGTPKYAPILTIGGAAAVTGLVIWTWNAYSLQH